ncbi:hypothetical protein AT241_06080 [Bartonella henselae]|nr:hypothetical protein AT241_06080 [Bartonella henselae]
MRIRVLAYTLHKRKEGGARKKGVHNGFIVNIIWIYHILFMSVVVKWAWSACFCALRNVSLKQACNCTTQWRFCFA